MAVVVVVVVEEEEEEAEEEEEEDEEEELGAVGTFSRFASRYVVSAARENMRTKPTS